MEPHFPMSPEIKQEVHLSGYQARDHEVVDYQMYELGGTGLSFRGPEPASLQKGGYFTCIGAAQTLGCFCERPYPTLLSTKLGMSCLNLGYGGAGPEFFVKQERLLPYINNSRFVVVQVMSGRSQSNSVFECGGLEYMTRKSDGARMGANEAYQSILNGSNLIRNLPPKRLSAALGRRIAMPKLRRLVEETRGNWCRSQSVLQERITVPIVLVWFSKREPDYLTDYRSIRSLFGEFPQLINREMIEKVRTTADLYVECVTSRGSPQALFSRFSGELTTVDPANDRPDLKSSKDWTHNVYYPSPEMNEDVAEALLPTCLKLMA